MKRVGLYGIAAIAGLLTASMPMSVHSETSSPQWQADLELAHESDSLANVHAESTKPTDIGLAIAILAGFASCTILGSKAMRASQPDKNNRDDI